METNTATQLNSAGWMLFVKTSFLISVVAMAGGIVFFPAELSVKGFFAMGTLYLIGSTFTLAKTIRDEFEGQKLVNRLADAKAEKILKEYDT